MSAQHPDLVEPQEHFPHVLVPAKAAAPWPSRPVALDARIVGAGRVWDLGDFLTATTSTALVVVVDGVLVHEQYLDETTPEDRLLGNSATKSALAHLVGIAIRRGLLPDLEAPVTDFVPELSGGGYDQVQVRHVLTMTTGVDWAENYHDPNSPASRMRALWHSGQGGSRELITQIGPGDEPGSRYAYCSPDSMVLDWVRERVTGQPFAEALAELWAALGAERPAAVGLDAPAENGGVALAAGSLVATARDWARIGMLQIDGSWAGNPVLDRTWVDESSRPETSFLQVGRLPSTITTHAGFGRHWWPVVDDGSRVVADGMRGQFVYVDRPRRIVVVKTSAWPYEDPWWDRQCRDLSYLALPAIAEAAYTQSR